MIETNIYKNRQVSIPGKENVMESYSWMEHAARRILQRTRPEMRAVIKKQGYGLK